MLVRLVRYFEDNYCYIFKSLSDKAFTVVDPGDTDFILNKIKSEDILIDKVVITHKHWDHIGDLKAFYSGLQLHYQEKGLENHQVQLISSGKESIPVQDINVCEDADTEVLEFENYKMTCFHAPCHTRGHILFYVESKESTGVETTDPTGYNEVSKDTVQCDRFVLTGDTVFIGGTGKFFEGNGTEMTKNFDFIASLPKDTQIFCGHDYLKSSVKFALGIEWENPAYNELLEMVAIREQKSQHLIPFSVGNQLESNIFLRNGEQAIMERIGVTSRQECMSKLRELKDNGVSLK